MQKMKLYLATSAALASQLALANPVEELVISAQRDTRTIDVTDALLISPDVAQLLKEAPGANVNSNGPITGIPQYRGMYGPRIAISLDGNMLAPAGPNWMDPPISYAVTAQLESLEVYRGIAPVSVAQESIGGAIDARTRHGEFTSSETFELQGESLKRPPAGFDKEHPLMMSLYLCEPTSFRSSALPHCNQSQNKTQRHFSI